MHRILNGPLLCANSPLTHCLIRRVSRCLVTSFNSKPTQRINISQDRTVSITHAKYENLTKLKPKRTIHLGHFWYQRAADTRRILSSKGECH